MSINKESGSFQETFSKLYDEYMPKVYRYIYYKVNDIPTAEDITAEVFDKVVVNFSKFNKNKASFSTWLFTIARNAVVDYFRAHGKGQNVPIDEAAEMPQSGPSLAEVVENAEETQTLQACIARLPPDEQEIVRLKFTLELNNREIARLQGLSESNVGVKLYRIIRKLRESFQELEYG